MKQKIVKSKKVYGQAKPFCCQAHLLLSLAQMAKVLVEEKYGCFGEPGYV
jgi:hypothetical protein